MTGALPGSIRSAFRRTLVVTVIVALVNAILPVRPAAAVTGDIRMHDPSVLKVGDCFYGFSTGFEGGPGNGSVTIRRTCDATLYARWTYVGTVWDSPPDWITQRLGTTPPNIWAPDINYFNGKFHLYYAASIWGRPGAVTGLATATDIEGPWTDAGPVTDVNYPIDPNVAWSGDTPYLMWGSWNGIYMHVLDAATGKLSTTDHNLWKLSTGIENPTITFDGGYFYLLGSRGSCCVGVNSTYYTVVGRSTSITGPYLDKNGVDMARGGGSTILTGRGDRVAAGGADIFADGPATRLVYHFYDATQNGRETVDVRRLTFVDGWPTVGSRVGDKAPANYRLTNVADRTVLAGSTDGGSDVGTGDWATADHQQWQFEPRDGHLNVINRASGKCLDVSSGSTADGARVIQWTCGRGTNQQWSLTPVGKRVQLVARHSGKCVATSPAAGTTPADVVQTTCVASDRTQLWERENTDTAVPAPSVPYEAESPANTRTGGAVVSDCAHCSGHAKVRSTGTGRPSSLTVNGVRANVTGSVVLNVTYTNGSVAPRTATLTVNGEDPVDLAFPATGSASRPGTVSTIIYLNRGANTVTISNDTGSGPDLDLISVEALPGT